MHVPSDTAAVMAEPDDAVLRLWLLHRLPEPQVADLEARLLSDPAFGMRVDAVETDLLDDYARDSLDAEDRQAVARWLLATPASRLRAAFAAALGALRGARVHAPAPLSRRSARVAARTASPLRLPAPRSQRQWLTSRGALRACAAALLLLIGYAMFGNRPKPANPLLLANAPTITLLANLERDSAAAPSVAARVPLAAPAIRLQVEVAGGEAAARYSVALTDIDSSRPTFEAHGLVAQTRGPYRFVEVALQPAALGSGDHRVELRVDGEPAPAQTWTLRTHAQ